MNIKFGHEAESKVLNGGEQHLFQFENGYGASVIKHKGSYGYIKGLWELAVLDSEGNLTYDTEITSDVIGYMSDKHVEDTLNAIKAL